jgi:hypothetical protein
MICLLFCFVLFVSGFVFLFSLKRGLIFFGDLARKKNVTFTKPIGSTE